MKKTEFIAILLVFFISSIANAYNSSTEKDDKSPDHQRITKFAIDSLNINPTIKLKLEENRGTLDKASEAEDVFINLMHHFYDPTAMYLCGTADRSASPFLTACAIPNARDYAISYYDLARKDKDWDSLGRALHLLQDMSVPSHVNRALAGGLHPYQAKFGYGYEWWVTRHWESDLAKADKTTGYLDKFFNVPQFRYTIKAGNMAGFIDAVAEQTYFGGFPYDKLIFIPTPVSPVPIPLSVSDAEADYTAKILIPMIIRTSGGLLEKFYSEVTTPQSNNKGPGGGNPDDNFDVSSRRIELEQLDVTKQAWKDLYGRTGVKKGYNGLFLEKAITESYARMASTTSEADYSLAAQQFDLLIDRAQKEAKHSFEDTYCASADVALLSDAFVDNAAELLLKRLKEPIREVKETLNPAVLLKNQPVLLVPSGALTGFNDSPMLKASLDEYVKQGGTLIVLSQKHGYDYASIPTPDGRPITGYGWEEDQNCFADSVSIESWHQMFSGQSRSTPTLNVDGYFTGYPANSTILLRRTANGQPALLMYEHGAGRVIVTSMYSDWAYGHGQASEEEISLVRDILFWAKKPAQLSEIKRGETVTLPVTLTNSTATNAASIKLQVWNPDRSSLLSEQTMNLAIPAGQPVDNNFAWQAPTNAALGIYHVDYILLDSGGNVIQPQAETDSGRFVVSSPPQTGTIKKDIWLSITSPNQEVFLNEPFVFTFHVFNNSATTRNLTLKSWLPHTYRGHEWTVTATANNETVITGSYLFTDSSMFETMRAYLYDENGVEIGSYMLSFKGVYPQLDVTTTVGKKLYSRGETIDLSVRLDNSRSLAAAVKMKITVLDPSNSSIYSTTQDLTIEPNGTARVPVSFPLPASAQAGSYTISTEALDSAGNKTGGDSAAFEIPLRFVAVTPGFPTVWNPGVNTVSFSLLNLGILPVSSGILDVTFNDPDGVVVASRSQPFSLDAGQSKVIDVPVSVPTLKFGSYTLSHTQSDESNNGKPVTVSLPNTLTTTASFDKPSYRIRETANLNVDLTNSGRFNLANVSVTLSAADAGYTDTKIINIGKGQSLPFQYAIPLPESMTAGQHTASITLMLPEGSTITRNVTFTVPQSLLALSLNQTSYMAGSVISPVITNSGGVDTLAQYTLSLYDARSVMIANQSLTETVPANGILAPNLPVPAGNADGVYTLVVKYTDMKAGRGDLFQKPLTIAGVKAALTVQSDKQSYLTTESIVALSSIANNGTEMQGGKLHLQVATAGGSQVKRSWSSQYDFQQGIRSGVDSFDSPGAVTLLSYADSFSSGMLDLDRWIPGVIGGTFPFVENGQLNLSLPLTYSWIRSYVNSTAKVSGDFDATVDYDIDKTLRDNGDNHPAGMQVNIIDPYLTIWVDVWGEPLTYGSADNGYSIANGYDATYKGSLRIKRVGSNYFTYYWYGNSWVNLLSSYNRPVGPTKFMLIDVGPNGKTIAHFDNFSLANMVYVSTGTLRLKNDYGRSEEWGNLGFDADLPQGTSLSFRTRAAETEAGLATASWSSPMTVSNAAVTSPKGRWLEVEASMSTTSTLVSPVLRELTVTQGHNPGDILWQTDVPVNLAQEVIAGLNNSIGSLSTAGKYYLQASLTSATGQTIATAEQPFFVAKGNTLLTFTSDKRIYKPGETVTLSGEVKNLATAQAASLNLVLTEKPAGGAERGLYSANFTISAGGSSPFTVTTTAGVEGAVAITGSVIQNSSILAAIADQYEVAAPKVTAALAAPDMAGDDPFVLSLTLANTGKTDASITVVSSIATQPLATTIPAGQSKLFQYSQQISSDTIDVFTLSGDLAQTVTKTVKYGPAVTLSPTAPAIYPEGSISLPIIVTNSGQIDSRFTIDYQLTKGASVIDQQVKDYFLAKGTGCADSLLYDLAEGSYQLAATSRKPSANASASFQVRKETRGELTLSVGAQNGNLLLATVNVENLGYKPIEGSVRVSLVSGNGITVWTAMQDVTLPQTLNPDSRTLLFSLNLSSLKPGSYTVKAELLDAGNRQLTSRTALFSLLGPTFAITQLPPYRTILPGGSSDFTFKVKNIGNQEGKFDLSFKADDLINTVRSEWLKPGEEKDITFVLQAGGDLDEKDFFASYCLKMPGSGISEQGTLKYHLQGLNLAVIAALDRQAYNPGDSATLTLTVTQQDSGAAPNLFARVNYNGYNEKQAFTLNSSQTLTFTVPISQITGEKLFYGIYAESGRSIHLNTIYLRKADAELSVSTDKQLYNPGETVTVVTSGSATGDLTLSGPGEFAATLAYSGSDTRSLPLPITMTSGTYTIKAQLKSQNPEPITVSYPFDVAGIQVKVKEALLDKAKYAASDTIGLTLAIESNLEIAATIKTWVVDPAGSYSEAGKGDLTLTASEPLLSTLSSQLSTSSLGIHKLVYGIYQGDLLLASGAKAFDIGEAVLLGLVTDRADYTEVTLPINVKADLYATVTAGIELFLDGTSIKADSVTLSGPGSYSFTIPPAGIIPGLHTLKGVITSGGLTSGREIRFTYGSNLPDLTARIASQPPSGGTVNLSLTLSNQGKTAAAGSRATLYDGDPATGGLLLTTLDVPSIAAGSSVTLPYVWNALGKSGDHILYAKVDSDNSVVEFIEENNVAVTALSLPSLSLAVSTGKGAYGANEAALISVSLANLNASLPVENSTLKLRLSSASGLIIDLPDKGAGTIAPATMITLSNIWNTGISKPSTYSITARLVSGGIELASSIGSFTIVPTSSLSGSIAPLLAEVPQETSLTALFTIANNGNIPVDGVLQGIIRDSQSGITRAIQETCLQLPVADTKTGTFSFPVTGLQIKGYDLLLSFVSVAGETVVAQSQFNIKDTIPPILTVSTLRDNSYTNNETLNVAGTVSDNSGSVKVEINGAEALVGADGSFSHALLLKMPDNQIEVIAFDLADNRAYDTRTIHLDQTAPALTIISPSDNSKTGISPIEVKGTVGETATVTVRLKESVQTAAIDGTDFSATVLPLPGWNTIEITAIDQAGNPGNQKRSVLFDDQKPSLAINEPAQDIRTNKGSLTISGTASDPYTAVGVTVTMEGTILTPAVMGDIFSQIVTFTEEKLYPITVIATNEVGTQVSAQRNIIYDKTPPTLTIDPVVTPTNISAQVVSGTREKGTIVAVTCATATVGAMEYPDPVSWRVALTGLRQGENRLQASVTDLAGNRTITIATILYVPKAPEVTISASPNQLWSPNKKLVPVTISGNVVTYGSDIKETTISVADEYGKYNLQGLRFGDTVLLEAWREGSDMDGRVYTITAIVTDQAGNRTTRSTTVTVPHDMGK